MEGIGKMKEMKLQGAELFLRYLLFAPRTDSDRTSTGNQFDAQAALMRAKRTVQSPLPVMKCGKGVVRNKAIRIMSGHICANIAVLHPESLFPRCTGALALLLALFVFQPQVFGTEVPEGFPQKRSGSEAYYTSYNQSLYPGIVTEKSQNGIPGSHSNTPKNWLLKFMTAGGIGFFAALLFVIGLNLPFLIITLFWK